MEGPIHSISRGMASNQAYMEAGSMLQGIQDTLRLLYVNFGAVASKEEFKSGRDLNTPAF